MSDDTVNLTITFDPSGPSRSSHKTSSTPSSAPVGGGGIGVEWNASIVFKQTRGTSPYFFTIYLSDISGLPDPSTLSDGAKCSFNFSTPGASGGRANLSWKWYLVRIEPARSDNGLHACVFGDERWKMDQKRYSMSYNIQWPDGSFRSDTVKPGGQYPWKALDAIKDAASKMGYELDTSRVDGFDPALLGGNRSNIWLPNNLGNSPAGGWVYECPSEIFKPMLNALDCDLIVKCDGTLAVVARTGDGEMLSKATGYPKIDDTVGPGQNGWELPRKLKIGFEIKSEAVIESDLGRTSSFTPIFDVPENVTIRPTLDPRSPQAWWLGGSNGVAESEWIGIQELLEDLGFVTKSASGSSRNKSSAEVMIAANWFLPQVVPLKRRGEWDEVVEDGDPATNAILYQTKIWCDAAIRQTWRRVYRIKYPESSASAGAASPLSTSLRAMAGLRFGRLTPGGESVSKGGVFCEWSEESTHALQFSKTNPLDARFSDNHAFDPQRAAPFSAKWVSQTGNELIYEITPSDAKRISQAKIFPGLLAKQMTYGDWFTLTSDGNLNETEIQGAFDSDFDYRVYLSGRLIDEDKRSGVTPDIEFGSIDKRMLVMTVDLFADGSMPELDLKSEQVTANYGYTTDQMNRRLGELAIEAPGRLLNSDQIRKMVEDAKYKIRERMKAGRAGGISIAGVSPVQDGLFTSGDIHEMTITVGDPDPWSIKTQFIVMPGIKVFDLNPSKRDGNIPNIIDQE